MSTEPLRTLSELAGDGQPAWVVGGAVRDELLGRPTLDYDIALSGDAGPLAKALGRAAGGHAFLLSDEFGAWRVKGREQEWQVDITPLLGETLEQDLRRRDLTINAIARPLAGGELIDPCGGISDLTARRLRAAAQSAFSGDPLRVMRLARFHAELGFAAEPETVALARRSAPALDGVAGERIFTELRQLMASGGVLDGLELMHQTGATAVVLPELEALRGIEQSEYHHLDVHDHTLMTLAQAVELARDPAPIFGDEAAAGLVAVLAEPLANELTRAEALRFGALLHDIAKSQTHDVTPEGRVTFIGHDQAGARQVITILGRLKASERLSAHVAALTRHHLRLGFLVHERPLSPHDVYRYLSACTPVEVDVTVLSVADRLATLGRRADEAVAKHLELAREILPAALAFRADPPKPPIRGDELAEQLGIAPGPQLGELLAKLTEAAYAGEVATAEDAVAHAREQLLSG
ncbi:MAG TPA: HD domain-containing protein [Solirubrobacteraceae bacterium]|nr:HD domain-containing protein [Solirubrobacteraceae bacterium]